MKKCKVGEMLADLYLNMACKLVVELFTWTSESGKQALGKGTLQARADGQND